MEKRQLRLPHQGGFSLVELLVVTAIIGVLVSLLLPAVQTAREASRRSRCQTNLRQIGLAMLHYEQQQGALPVGCLEKRTAKNPKGRQLSWIVSVLPQLEQKGLHNQLRLSAAYDDLGNHPAAEIVLSVLLCPSTTRLANERVGNWAGSAAGTRGLAACDYGGNYGAAFVSPTANGVLLYDRPVALREITDGTSNTLLVTEDTGRDWIMDGEWINGENIFDQLGPINSQQHNEIWSDHPGGAVVVCSDASVHFLDEEISPDVLRAFCTRSGAEVSR